MNASLRRYALFCSVAALVALAWGSGASAAVEMSTGVRYVVPAGALDECRSKAQTALSAYLMNVTEPSPGQFVAAGPIGVVGSTTANAVVGCSVVGKGYAVTFTCVVQTPENPYTADDLCIDVAHNFSGKPVKPLATPAPLATGCTTANLVGSWTSDKDPKLTLTMNVGGDLTDSDGVSGNWILYGTNATLTYYGTHNLTLSSDGKHLRGGGSDYTRKC